MVPTGRGATVLSEKDRPLSVSQLNQILRELLETTVGQVWIEAELSNCKVHYSGHMYLSLKDEKAQVRAVMFKPNVMRLRFEPEDGQSVLVRGRVSVYEPRGEYQVVIDRMEPTGLGSLQLAFLQLKEKLEKEGLFDPAHKRPIPALPKRVGVVTSPVGAAIRDFLNVARRRFSNIDIVISPAAVQGEGAPQEIVAALETLTQLPDLDAIVVTRGGGSIEDLWAFNSEAVARAIRTSRVPVISAVGHEVDFTIADFVADLRAPTPSAAAELLIRSKETEIYRLSSLTGRLDRAMRRVIQEGRSRVQTEVRAFPDMLRWIQDARQRVDDLGGRIVRRMEADLERAGRRLDSAASRLATLNPLATLGRGYALVTRPPGKRTVTDASRLSPGDRVHVLFRKGSAECGVLSVNAERSLFAEPSDGNESGEV